MCVVVAGVAVVVAVVPGPVCPEGVVAFEAADEPQPATSRAAPSAPKAAVLNRVFGISIH